MKNILKFQGIIYLIFLINYTGYAQGDFSHNLTSYSMASPEVSSLEKYNLGNVNYYTGKVDINIPIYTIKTGNIEYPIALVYNTGGIKVDQSASDVGLGWNITNSILTRTINQTNDFDSYPENAPMVQKKRGFFNNRNFPMVYGTNSEDLLPDTYHFYANGSNVNFFFSDVNTPIEINPKGTKIQAIASEMILGGTTHNLSTKDFFSIVITTNDGLKYTFSDCDYSLEKEDNRAQISAWHITKIEDLNTEKKIDFIYENTSSNPTDLTKAQRSCGYTTDMGNSNGNVVYNYNFATQTRIDLQKKRLKKIVFDEGELVFNYNNIGVSGQALIVRDDVYNADCITQIYLRNKSFATVKTFNFSYGYFTSNYNVGEYNPDSGAYNSYRYKRLKLLSFWETGKPKYKFSYEETQKLPAINSFSTDFLGYFNNSPDKATIWSSEHPFATLYYYKNQFEKSVLPFNIPSMNPIVLPGYFNREANSYAKTWSLNKVEYPTGGWSEYIYEPNKFQLFGEDITGGGIRIAQQKLTDGTSGIIQTINYKYTKSDGHTSGTLASIPFFGFPSVPEGFGIQMNYPPNEQPAAVTNQYSQNPNDTWWILFDKSNLNSDLTTGSYVGYSRVIVSEIGHGRREFNFTSNDQVGFSNIIYRVPPELLASGLPQVFEPDMIYYAEPQQDGRPQYYLDEGRINFMIANSGVFSNVFTDKGYKRGKLTEQKIFDEAGNILKHLTINYTDNLLKTYTFRQGFFEPSSAVGGYGYTTSDPRRQPYCMSRSCAMALMIAKKDILVSQFLPILTKIKTYSTPSSYKEEITNLTYNANGILKSSQNYVTGDNNSMFKSNYFYVNDIISTTSLPGETLSANEYNSYVSYKNNTNNISTRIQTQYYSNKKLISTKRITFRTFDTSNLILPEFVKFSKASNSFYNLSTIYSCEFGTENPTEISTMDGSKTALVWGYNKTKLIAKIENFSYKNLSTTVINNLQTLSNNDNDFCRTASCKEQLLREALNNLRSSLALTYPEASVTTYTYDPLVGVTSTTSPKGEVQYYTYDYLQRLVKVEDQENNILAEKEYHFKPQNP